MLPYINYPFEYLSKGLGASADELKLITSFVISYPLAGLLKRIPDSRPAYKNLFIISVSIFYLIGLFDLWAGLRTLLISSVGAYVIAGYVTGPFMPWIAFVFLMSHLSVNQLARQWGNAPNKIDVTGAQMVLVMKLTAFCWNIHDGRLPQKDLSEYQRERALSKLPNIMDFAGYVFFFPSLFAGPAFDYAEYHRWIDTSMFEVPVGTDPAKRAPTRKKRKIPRSGTPAVKKAIIGFVWIFAFLKFDGWFNTKLLVSDRYMTYGFLSRVWILYMYGFTSRLKYYGVWSLTEGACILSGLGYNGIDPKTGQVRWDRLQNVAPWPLETAQNTRAYLENWNINTNHWLRNYLYLRVTPKGKKPGFRASLATFVTSAFWHGFYPGYYLTFVLAAFLQTIAKNFRRHIRPFFLTPTGQPTALKPLYDAISYVLTQLAFSFTTAPFVLLTVQASLLVWSRVYFYCVLGTALSMALFASPAKPFLVRALQRRNGAAAVGAKGPAGPGAGAGASAGARPGAAVRTESHDGSHRRDTVLGLPDDPGRDFDEALQEVRGEVEAMRSRGFAVSKEQVERVAKKKGL